MVRAKLVVEAHNNRVVVFFGDKENKGHWHFGHAVNIEHNVRSTVHNVCCALKALDIPDVEITYKEQEHGA